MNQRRRADIRWKPPRILISRVLTIQRRTALHDIEYCDTIYYDSALISIGELDGYAALVAPQEIGRATEIADDSRQ